VEALSGPAVVYGEVFIHRNAPERWVRVGGPPPPFNARYGQSVTYG
jgi:hypothetical protein